MLKSWNIFTPWTFSFSTHGKSQVHQTAFMVPFVEITAFGQYGCKFTEWSHSSIAAGTILVTFMLSICSRWYMRIAERFENTKELITAISVVATCQMKLFFTIGNSTTNASTVFVTKSAFLWINKAISHCKQHICFPSNSPISKLFLLPRLYRQSEILRIPLYLHHSALVPNSETIWGFNIKEYYLLTKAEWGYVDFIETYYTTFHIWTKSHNIQYLIVCVIEYVIDSSQHMQINDKFTYQT